MSEFIVEVSDGYCRPNPPTMIKVTGVQTWQKTHETSTAGLFASVFSYPTEDPYIGGVIGPFYLDFDCIENPNKSRKEAAEVVRKLIEDYRIPEATVSITFSGCKGFHLIVSPEVFNIQPCDLLPAIYKSIAEELARKLKLKTLDLGIYDRRRLWRLLNSKHDKTRLYAIQLTKVELENLDIEQIKQLALNPREPFIQAEAKPVQEAEQLFNEHKEKVENWLLVRKQRFEAKELKPLNEDPPVHQEAAGDRSSKRQPQHFNIPARGLLCEQRTQRNRNDSGVYTIRRQVRPAPVRE